MQRKLPACDRMLVQWPGPPGLIGKEIRSLEACSEPLLLTYFHSDPQHRNRNQFLERTPR